jgi:hypothetical protein
VLVLGHISILRIAASRNPRGYVLGVSTPEEDYRELLPTLLGLYPSLGGLRLKDEYRPLTHVVHGWYLRCHRGVEAILRLEEGGYQIESAPIRRSVLEHVVALKWLAQEGSVVVDILVSGAGHDAKKRKESIEAAGWASVDAESFDAVIADAEGVDNKHDNQLLFRTRCDRAGTKDDWASYLIETGQSHPCWESAVPYFKAQNDKVLALMEPEPRLDQAGFCVLRVQEALVAVNHIAKGRPLNQRLQDTDRQVRSIAARQRRERGLAVPDGFDPGERRRRS